MTATETDRAAGEWLHELEVKARLAERGISVPRSRRVADARSATAAAAELRFPLVLKLASPGLVHKSDIGGVVLGLGSADEVSRAAASLLAIAAEADLPDVDLVLEEQRPPGVELIVGALADENFGTIVTVGLGGVWVEVLSDVTVAFAPISVDDADRMLTGLRAWPLLAGGRGRPPVDLAGLRSLLMAVGGPGGLALEPGFDQLDLNPVIARAEDVFVVDAKLRLGEAEADRRSPLVPPTPAGSLGALLNPNRVAMVGASATDSLKTANSMLRGFQNARRGRPLVCIHPRAADGLEAIEGVPCFASLAEAGGDFDLVTLAISIQQIPGFLRSAAGHVRVAHIMASPPEDDRERRELYHELLKAARDADIRLVGPNCLGVHSPAGGMSWLTDVSLEPGRASVVTQSGGFGGNLISFGTAERLGFSRVVSIGDSLDVKAAEVLGYLLADPDTRCIGLHVETARGARELYEQIIAQDVHKPIVMLKAGRTDAGGRAADSHTRALAGDFRTWRAFELQAGVTIASSLQEFLAVLKFFERHHSLIDEPEPAALLLGSSGGFAVLGADALVSSGVLVSPLAERTRARVLDLLGPPVGETYDNPLDTLSGPRSYKSILDVVLDGERVTDVVNHLRLDLIYQFLPNADVVVREFAEAVGALPAAFPDTRFSLAVIGSKRTAEPAQRVAEVLADTGVAVFDSFDDLAAGIRGAAVHARRWSAGDRHRAPGRAFP